MDGAISDLTHAGARPDQTRESETSVELQAGRGAAKPQHDPIAINRGLSPLRRTR